MAAPVDIGDHRPVRSVVLAGERQLSTREASHGRVRTQLDCCWGGTAAADRLGRCGKKPEKRRALGMRGHWERYRCQPYGVDRPNNTEHENRSGEGSINFGEA